MCCFIILHVYTVIHIVNVMQHSLYGKGAKQNASLRLGAKRKTYNSHKSWPFFAVVGVNFTASNLQHHFLEHVKNDEWLEEENFLLLLLDDGGLVVTANKKEVNSWVAKLLFVLFAGLKQILYW